MPRRLRISTGGLVYHVLNRAVGRSQLFDDEADYTAMIRVIERSFALVPIRIVSYCLMPNHWHMVLWPREDGQLSEFMRLLTVTHTQRWHAQHQSAGTGPIYQGRFKSFPIQRDEHCLTVCRYVERNAVRTNLVKSARDWRWNSLAERRAGAVDWLLPLKHWPTDAGANWENRVNKPQTAGEESAVQEHIRRGRPYGSDRWEKMTAKKLGLESTMRPRGRQRVRPIKESRPL